MIEAMKGETVMVLASGNERFEARITLLMEKLVTLLVVGMFDERYKDQPE